MTLTVSQKKIHFVSLDTEEFPVYAIEYSLEIA